MPKYFYSSINSNLDGRASHFYMTEAPVAEIVNDQNVRAEAMGLKARYSVTSHESEKELDRKDVRI
jgi:hypothetical protein